MALFETKIQTKKQYSPKAVEQKDLYFYELYKNLKKTKEFWPFYTFIWKNELKFDDKKVYFTVFVLKKVTFLGSLRAKYNSKWMKISNCYTLKLWHYYKKSTEIGTVHC